MRLSVIVPVLNEAALLRDFIAHLRARLPAAEIVIVDGGSDDSTWDALETIRERYSLSIRRASRGRASQMNAGAIVSRGDVLLFLHADSRLPPDCESAIDDLLADPGLAGGCFRLRFPRSAWIYRVSDSLGNVAVDCFGIACGDHGIFCRRDTFFAAGAFPEVPLMEDADFCRALQRHGRLRQVRAEIESSPRRYEELGPYRTTVFYLFILLLYLVGVEKQRLASWHSWFTRSGSVAQARQSTTPSGRRTGNSRYRLLPSR